MRVAIVGSRTVRESGFVEQYLDTWLWRQGLTPSELTVVSGGARGADTLGERWAQARGIETSIFPANWDRYGKRAGFLRNEEMVGSGLDFVIAFVDKPLEESRGTSQMVGLCRAAGVEGVVVRLRRIER